MVLHQTGIRLEDKAPKIFSKKERISIKVFQTIWLCNNTILLKQITSMLGIQSSTINYFNKLNFKTWNPGLFKILFHLRQLDRMPHHLNYHLSQIWPLQSMDWPLFLSQMWLRMPNSKWFKGLWEIRWPVNLVRLINQIYLRIILVGNLLQLPKMRHNIIIMLTSNRCLRSRL
jgi:hypothetical protein